MPIETMKISAKATSRPVELSELLRRATRLNPGACAASLRSVPAIILGQQPNCPLKRTLTRRFNSAHSNGWRATVQFAGTSRRRVISIRLARWKIELDRVGDCLRIGFIGKRDSRNEWRRNALLERPHIL